MIGGEQTNQGLHVGGVLRFLILHISSYIVYECVCGTELLMLFPQEKKEFLIKTQLAYFEIFLKLHFFYILKSIDGIDLIIVLNWGH